MMVDSFIGNRTRPLKAMRHRRGFTLIELLVAITILAIVAVLGWRGLDSIVRARIGLTSELEQTRGLQLAFAQMQSDCDHIVTRTTIGNRQSLSAQPGRLTLVRTVFAENQPSRVQVIAYRVRDGVLVRRESIATRNLAELDAAWNAALNDTDVAEPVVLHSSINDMAIRTWTGVGTAAGWRPAGATQAPPPPPGVPGAPTADPNMTTGLEVTLQVRDRTGSLVKVFLLGAA